MSSLYDRLGGEAAVEAAVVRFHRKVIAHPEISPFFAGHDVAYQMERHIGFMVRVFGGPSDKEVNLQAVHAKLVARGLAKKHVDLFLGVLEEVLRDLEVGETEIREVMTTAEGSRSAVLGGTAGGPRGGGGGGGGSSGAGHLFDRVHIADEGVFTASEFLALPLAKRVTFVVQNRAMFYAGDVPIDADTALADARKRRLSA